MLSIISTAERHISAEDVKRATQERQKPPVLRETLYFLTGTFGDSGAVSASGKQELFITLGSRFAPNLCVVKKLKGCIVIVSTASVKAIEE